MTRLTDGDRETLAECERDCLSGWTAADEQQYREEYAEWCDSLTQPETTMAPQTTCPFCGEQSYHGEPHYDCMAREEYDADQMPDTDAPF